MPNRLSNTYTVSVLDPIADAFAGTVATDVVEVAGHGIKFIIGKGVGATGTSTVTLLACDDFVPTNTTAVIFWYRAMTVMGTWGAWTAATVAGFVTTLGSSQLYEVFTGADVIGVTGYPNAQLNLVEVTDSPVLGYVLAEVEPTRYSTQTVSLLA